MAGSVGRMTRYERWSLIISGATAAVTLGGFGFIWLQLKSANDSLRTGVYANMSNWTFELDKASLEHPELRPYFYDGKDIDESDPLYPTAAAMAEFHLDTFDSIMEYNRSFAAADLHEGWSNWMMNAFDASPILVHTIEKMRSEYQPGPVWPIFQRWKARKAAAFKRPH
jgi:hypothetical protein